MRSDKTTGPPALITVGYCAVMMSVPRLSSRAEILMTAIMIAAARPTTTILRCVARFAVYSDEFMKTPNHCGHQRNIVFPDNAPIPTYNARTRGNILGRMYALGSKSRHSHLYARYA